MGWKTSYTALYIRDPNRAVATHIILHIIRELGLADQEESLISFVPDRHFNDLPPKVRASATAPGYHMPLPCVTPWLSVYNLFCAGVSLLCA